MSAMVEVYISATGLYRLKPAPVSLLDGGPVGGHVLLYTGGMNRTVVASVDAPTARLAAVNQAVRWRSLGFILAGMLLFVAAAIIGGVLGSGRHIGAGRASFSTGAVVAIALSAFGTRSRKRRTQPLPLTARRDRSGGVVVGPVDESAAQAWADANIPGSLTILQSGRAEGSGLG